MPLTQSQRNQIATYKVRIEGLRKDIQSLMEQKKRTSADYSHRIKSTSDQKLKRTYRQNKITALNGLVNRIESKKQEIEHLKGYLKNIRG